MRNPPAAELCNEEISNLITRKFQSHPWEARDLTVRFEQEGDVTSVDTEQILERITSLHKRVLDAAQAEDDRRRSLLAFAENLAKGESVLPTPRAIPHRSA